MKEIILNNNTKSYNCNKTKTFVTVLTQNLQKNT